MTPMERAARALCELAGNPPGATLDGKPLWQDYLPEVRAVLQAIREPSEGMIISGIAERHEQPVPEAWSLATENIFRAMIDAALAE
jgi:hypothetical protein